MPGDSLPKAKPKLGSNAASTVRASIQNPAAGVRRPLQTLSMGKERSFEPLIIPAVRERPAKLGAPQVIENGALANRATARDLPLPQSQFISESKYFFDPAHR